MLKECAHQLETACELANGQVLTIKKPKAFIVTHYSHHLSSNFISGATSATNKSTPGPSSLYPLNLAFPKPRGCSYPCGAAPWCHTDCCCPGNRWLHHSLDRNGFSRCGRTSRLVCTEGRKLHRNPIL